MLRYSVTFIILFTTLIDFQIFNLMDCCKHSFLKLSSVFKPKFNRCLILEIFLRFKARYFYGGSLIGFDFNTYFGFWFDNTVDFQNWNFFRKFHTVKRFFISILPIVKTLPPRRNFHEYFNSRTSWIFESRKIHRFLIDLTLIGF